MTRDRPPSRLLETARLARPGGKGPRPKALEDPGLSPELAATLAARLASWYRLHRRPLPWREAPSAYAVWVSEVMLQQTQVATVIPYFEQWMSRFPTLGDLARADEAAVLHAWQGLGYYARARSLLEGARIVVRDYGGALPQQAALLRRLPGIGSYSAGAIASIAYGQPEPAVDGNVVRVLCRLFGLPGDPARSPLKPRLWSLARQLAAWENPADLTQGWMELGATLCVAREPQCRLCPLRAHCLAHRQGNPERLPELARRPPATPQHRVAALVWRGGRVLVVQLPPDAPWWAGMWQFPSARVRSGESSEQAAIRAVREAVELSVRVEAPLGLVRHRVTRYLIRLEAYRCRAVSGRAVPKGCLACKWRALDDLADLAMPAPQRRLVRLGGAPD